MAQAPNDLKSLLQAAIAAANRSQAEASGSPRQAPAKFLVLKETLEAAIKALDEQEPVDKAALSGISKWVADWIPDIEDPLLDRLSEVEQQVAKS
jgi:hypothetical protein